MSSSGLPSASAANVAPTTIQFPATVNGISEIGIAAGVDVLDEASMRVVFQQSNTDTPLLATLNPGGTADEKKLWNSLVAFVAKNGWYPRAVDPRNPMYDIAADGLAVTCARSVDDVNKEGFYDMQVTANLIVATKITWWLTNHHVGQDSRSLASYVGKVAEHSGLHFTETLRKMIWAAGKWVPTLAVLRAMGFQNLRPGGEMDNAMCGDIQFHLAADLVLRISSFPAGTAALTTYYAIIQRARTSQFSVCVPRIQEIEEASKVVAAIKANPVAYHIGAGYLTGTEALPCDVLSEETKENLSAFIHATSGKSSLAHSPVIMRQADVSGHHVYTKISSLRAATMSAGANEVMQQLLSIMSGADESGGLAVQLGLYTQEKFDEQLTNAKAKAKQAAEEKKKAKAEESKSA